jgi:hypothetical protein
MPLPLTYVRRGWPVATLSALLATTVALHLLWLIRFRLHSPTEWDEAGYIQIALLDRIGLARGGLRGLAEMVLAQPGQAPLVPLATVPFYLVAGEGILQSLLVIPLFFLWLVSATYLLARVVLGRGWSLLAALCVAALPVVTDYSRLYHFSVPAAATMTSALWALLRSEGLRRPGWALLAGTLVATMLLTRTMTLAYLPGLGLAALGLLVLRPGERRQQAMSLALGTLATVTVAAPWYGRNAGSVSSYLVEAGYGSRSGLYGDRASVWSAAFWTKELVILLEQLYLPVTCVLAAALLAGAPALARGRKDALRSPRAPALLALALVAAEGYLALTSSPNRGTAFSLPWLPALVVLAVASTASLPWPAPRAALAALLVAVSGFNLLMKGGFWAPLATVRTAALPGLAAVPLTDGTGIIQREVSAAGYPLGKPTEPLPRLHRQWLPLQRRLAGYALLYATSRGQEPHLVVAVDDLLFSNTHIRLAGALWYRRYIRTGQLYLSSDKEADYRADLARRGNNLLVTAESRVGMPTQQHAVEAAARSLGFGRIRSFRMPDGRTIWLWWRTTARA